MRQPSLTKASNTVIIPIKVVDGCFMYFYGGVLPEFKEGTIFDIVVPEYAIEDSSFVKLLQSPSYEEFLPANAVLYCGVAANRVPNKLQQRAFPPRSIAQNFAINIHGRLDNRMFVRVVLKEPLLIQLRGTKRGRLMPSVCQIPAIHREAKSLSHAYRLISEAFEPTRISHSGNVFREVVFVNAEGMCLDLDQLREDHQASNENLLKRA